MSGREEYKVRLSLAGKYRIGLNIVRTGKIGVKGLFLEYGEYSAEYSPTKTCHLGWKLCLSHLDLQVPQLVLFVL